MAKHEDVFDPRVFTEKEVNAAMAVLAAFAPIAEAVIEVYEELGKAMKPFLKFLAETYAEIYPEGPDDAKKE